MNYISRDVSYTIYYSLRIPTAEIPTSLGRARPFLPIEKNIFAAHPTSPRLYLRLRFYSLCFRLPLASLPFEVSRTNLDHALRSCVYVRADGRGRASGARGHSYFHTKPYDFTGSTFEGRERGFFEILSFSSPALLHPHSPRLSHSLSLSRFLSLSPFLSTPATLAGWASVTIFRMLAEALGKLCKPRQFPQYVGRLKGTKGWWDGRGARLRIAKSRDREHLDGAPLSEV